MHHVIAEHVPLQPVDLLILIATTTGNVQRTMQADGLPEAFRGSKTLPRERTPTDRFVRAAYYANGLPKPASPTEGAAYMFSVIRNVSVPFGLGDPDKPKVASTIFRTVMDLSGGRYYFESTYAPNVVWVDYSKLDFTKGGAEKELRVEQEIFSLNGDVTGRPRARRRVAGRVRDAVEPPSARTRASRGARVVRCPPAADPIAARRRANRSSA